MRLYLVRNTLEENGSNQKQQRAVPIQDQSILSFDDFERHVHSDSSSNLNRSPYDDNEPKIDYLDCDLIITSVGYKGENITNPEFENENETGDEILPFNPSKGIVENILGRVEMIKPPSSHSDLIEDDDGNESEGDKLASVYCSGWIKRGPTVF